MSRATNSFDHIRANAEGVDTTHRSESLRTAIADAITILAADLNGSVAFEDVVEKAVFELMEEARIGII